MLLVRVLTEDPDREDPKQTSGAEIPYYPQIRVSVRSQGAQVRARDDQLGGLGAEEYAGDQRQEQHLPVACDLPFHGSPSTLPPGRCT